MVNYIEEAKRWFETLLKHPDQYSDIIYYLRQALRTGGLTLADIGRTEEELEKLRIAGCKAAAEKWLAHLRDGIGLREMFLRCLADELKSGGLSPASIGAKEGELEALNAAPAS